MVEVVDGEKGLVKRPIQDPLGTDLVASRVYYTYGEYAKAAQYAEQAVNNEPGNARLRGNYGVMLSKNGKPDEAIDQLKLAIQGGITDDGDVIDGLPLDYDLRIIEYYSTYGLTLARANRCAQAIPKIGRAHV